MKDAAKVLTGVSIAFLIVAMAFSPLSLSSVEDVGPGTGTTRGGPVCEGTTCKQPNPDAAALYMGSGIRDPPSSTSSRASVNKYAVLAGISDYPGSGSDLNYCDDDVYDTRDLLIDMGWSSTNIHLLIDSQATNANILDEVAWMKQQEDADSQVWFHFSGHGSSGYFLTYGGTMTDDTLASAFNGYESTQRIIVMDTCHAGSFTALNMANTIGIMACSSSQYSYDGMFTPTFVNKFTTTSTSVEKAFNDAKNAVNSATGGAQTPVMWDNVAGDLLIGNSPPRIGSIPNFQSEEDTDIVADLTDYESDDEDSGIDLDWLVTEYDIGVIASIEGQQSDDDVLTFHPIADFSGSTEVELALKDSGGQQVKKTVTLTWTPVNDPPTVASLDRTKSSILRSQSLVFKVFGEDKDDAAAKVTAEVEYSPQGEGMWAPLTGSKYASGHWEVTWNVDTDIPIGVYDVRTRLRDEAGLTSDWLTRNDLITVLNNRPAVSGISVPTTGVERTGEITISVIGSDIEDGIGIAGVEVEYMPPGGDYLSAGSATFVQDHWEVVFHPGIEALLGWYDVRARALDSDGDNSDWFHDNATFEVQNSRPFVTDIVPEDMTVPRGSSLMIEVMGWDPEDSKIHLFLEVEYAGPDGDWTPITEGIEFSSDHWWFELQPAADALVGPYSVRARLIDTADAVGDWFEMNGTIEVTNNLPTVTEVLPADIEVIRTQDLEVRVKVEDVEDEASILSMEAEMKLGNGDWGSEMIGSMTWSPSHGGWLLLISPEASTATGDYGLRVRFNDTAGDFGEWSELLTIRVINGPPVVDILLPDIIHQAHDTVFDASSSYDPEGRALTFEWDMGDGTHLSGESPNHRYQRFGTFRVALTVTDLDGAEVVEEFEVEVNALPVPVTDATQADGINNFEVHFSTTGTRDPDGRIVSYSWDLDLDKDTNGDGDATNDVDSTEINPSFDYGEDGTYSYKLTVTDDQGAKAEHIGEVTVASMSMMTAGLIGGSLLLIIIVAAAAILLMRRRGRRGTAAGGGGIGKGSSEADKVAEAPPPANDQLPPGARPQHSLLDDEDFF